MIGVAVTLREGPSARPSSGTRPETARLFRHGKAPVHKPRREGSSSVLIEVGMHATFACAVPRQRQVLQRNNGGEVGRRRETDRHSGADRVCDSPGYSLARPRGVLLGLGRALRGAVVLQTLDMSDNYDSIIQKKKHDN